MTELFSIKGNYHAFFLFNQGTFFPVGTILRLSTLFIYPSSCFTTQFSCMSCFRDFAYVPLTVQVWNVCKSMVWNQMFGAAQKKSLDTAVGNSSCWCNNWMMSGLMMVFTYLILH